MKRDAVIYIAGHNGMVGSAIRRRLVREGFTNIIGLSSRELDLRDQRAVREFFEDYTPEFVFLAAAHVGGILANNTYKGDFIYNNLMIQSNVIHHAYLSGVKKLLFLGSSCIYPKFSNQPIDESELLSGPLEPTNEAYAVAKIAGIKMCQAYREQYGCNYICAMPTNLYGPNDNYDLENSHVLPALVRKICEAHVRQTSPVQVWGTGRVLREFLHVDDLADACYHLMVKYDDGDIVNVGTGEDVSILELANLIKETVGYSGELVFDPTRPEGTPRKLLNVSKMKSLGWQPNISLRSGLKQVCEEYLRTRFKSPATSSPVML